MRLRHHAAAPEQPSSFLVRPSSLLMLTVGTNSVPELTAAAPLAVVFSRTVTVRVYHVPSTPPRREPRRSWTSKLTTAAVIEQIEASGATWTAIPVHEVLDRRGRAYALALEVFAT